MLQFQSTHEYYLGDASIYYCSEHDSLIIADDYTDRLVISGISDSVIDSFIKKNSPKKVTQAKRKDAATV